MDSKPFPEFSDRFEYEPGRNDLYLTLEEIRRSGEEWIDLTLSNPTKARIVYPSEAILHSLSKPEGMEYDPNPKGILSARTAVSQYYEQRNLSRSAEDFFLTSSSSEAYSFLIKLLCNPGDEVLIPSPGYPLFEFISLLDGTNFGSYRLEEDRNWKIDFTDLRSKLSDKVKIVFIVTPNNPTGNLLTKEEWKELEDLASEHKFSLIIDEVFCDYAYSETETEWDISSSRVPVFTVNGLSKILGLPQMKLSWIHVAGPTPWKEECKERLEIITDTYLSVSTAVQLALPELLQWRKMIQGQILRRIQRNLQILEEECEEFSKLLRFSKPAAGWYGILSSKSFLPEEEFCIRLLKQAKVFAYPGTMFGFEEGSGTIVFGLLAENDEFQQAIRRITAFLK